MALNEFEWTERHTQLLAMKGLTGACTERGGEGEEKYENHGGCFKTRTATGCESTSETRRMKLNDVTDP